MNICFLASMMNIQELSMRPGQNKRMRGRNNRKGPNPLTRTYESNGPDVKIRGTAQHVAEKYLQLARDAQSSGDPVVAENYLQHAEHYFRIIAAAQVAQQQAQMGYNRNADDFEEIEEDEDFVALPDRFASPFDRPTQHPSLNQPQPNVAPPNYAGQPQPFFERPVFASDPQERPADRSERGGRADRRFGQQGERQQGHGRQRFRDQQGRLEANLPAQEQPRVDFEPTNPELPAFITSPTRPPANSTFPIPDEVLGAPPEGPVDGLTEQANAEALSSEISSQSHSEPETRFHLRPRRRRRPRPEAEGDENDGASVTEANSAE